MDTDAAPGDQPPAATPPAPEVADPMAAAEAEQAAEGDRIAHRKELEEHLIPGDRAVDRSYEHWIGRAEADLPDEEANAAAQASGDMAVAADSDRQAVQADAARLAAASPGSPEVAAAAQAAADIARLADDAIAEGLKVSQDALSAHAARKQGDDASAQAAEDAAQADEGQLAHDLAQADALRAKVEGHPTAEGADLPKDPV